MGLLIKLALVLGRDGGDLVHGCGGCFSNGYVAGVEMGGGGVLLPRGMNGWMDGMRYFALLLCLGFLPLACLLACIIQGIRDWVGIYHTVL